MKVAVVNCFHWIGYHLVETMLEDGIEVIGIHESETNRSNFLSMCIGRNSLFTRADCIPEDVDYTVAIGTTSIIPTCSYTIQLMKEHTEKKDISLHAVRVELPLLYGEWMSMDEKGIYVQNKYFPFTSNTFLNKGVYVQDYMKVFLARIHERITLQPDKKSFLKEELTLENNSCFRDNSTKPKVIEQLQKHYRHNRFFYEE